MNLKQSIMPERSALEKRFDFALTKKMGVIKLPPAFWIKDPKINPRSDHLYWAALLLLDPVRIEMARSVIAVEMTEGATASGEKLEEKIAEITSQLLACIPDFEKRANLCRKLREIMPHKNEFCEEVGQ